MSHLEIHPDDIQMLHLTYCCIWPL